MRIPMPNLASRACKSVFAFLSFLAVSSCAAFAQPTDTGGEANLTLPDLSSVSFLGKKASYDPSSSAPPDSHLYAPQAPCAKSPS
jgi:hypothetical protein